MSDTQRIDAALSALQGLSPEALRQAAQATPAPLNTVLSRLAGAMESSDPAASLQEALADLSVDSADLLDRLGVVEAAAGQRLAGLEQVFSALSGPLSQVEQAQERLRSGLEDMLEEGGDAALIALLRRALGLVEDQEPVRAVTEALQQGQALSSQLRALLRQARQDPAQAAALAQSIEEQVAALEETVERAEAAGSALPAVINLLSALRQQVAGQPAEVEIALAEAQLAEGAGQESDRRLQDRWRTALDLALRHQQLAPAQRAAQRLHLVALTRNDLPAAATASAEVATLAASVQDLRAEVLSRLEEALFLARMRDRRRDALARLKQALHRSASGDIALQARARLTAGQALMAMKMPAEARRAWRDLLQSPDAETDYPAEAGWAALYLARLEAARGRPDDARMRLEQARRLGRSLGLWSLYSQAVVQLLEDCRSTNDAALAAQIITEARALAPRLGGPQAVAALEGLATFLEGRWGQGFARS